MGDNISSRVDSTTKTFTAIMVLGLVGLLFLIVFGNLSGNLGFASGSVGETNTNAVINNLTAGASTFFTFSNVWFTLLAVVLLIIIVMSVIAVVQLKNGSGSFSS